MLSWRKFSYGMVRPNFVTRVLWFLIATTTSFGTSGFARTDDCVHFTASDDTQKKQHPYSDLSDVRLLVVGGTDGSGTRGVVALLERLGVPMVYDDAVSRDVHGAEMGGWPDLVELLLRATAPTTVEHDSLAPNSCFPFGSNRFPPQVSNLPGATVDAAVEVLAKVVRSSLKKRQAMRPDELQNIKDGKSSGNPSEHCADNFGIDIGIKAPVTLAVVPLLLKLGFKTVKLIHVVRDGRDLAFSSNQSPVEKFFNATFGARCWNSKELQQPTVQDSKGLRQESRDAALRAAHMWSTWNHGIYQWASECSKDASASARITTGTLTAELNCARSPRFEYLPLRIEDLLASGNTGAPQKSAEAHSRARTASTSTCTAARLTALARIAEFVESPAAQISSELCCLCAEPPPDLGRSIDFRRLKVDPLSHSEASSSKSRKGTDGFYNGYGKWKSFVAKDTVFGDALNVATGSVLATFGYSIDSNKVDSTTTGSFPSESKQQTGSQEQSPSTLRIGSYTALHLRCPAATLGATSSSATTCAQTFMGHVASEAQPFVATTTLDSVTGSATDRSSYSRSITQWHAAPCSFLGGVSVASPVASFAPGRDDPSTSVVRAASAEQCCAMCQMSFQAASTGAFSKDERTDAPPLCEHFSFDVHIGVCHIMGPPQGFARHASFISGWLAA